MSVEHLEAEILKLPRDIRARLAERLLSSLDDESEIEKAWIAEAEQRYQRFLDGDDLADSVESVLKRLRDEFTL